VASTTLRPISFILPMSRNLPYSSYALPIPGPGVNVSEPGVPLLYVPVPPLNPKPKPFPEGYGRQRIYYFEPKAINEYRFDI